MGAIDMHREIGGLGHWKTAPLTASPAYKKYAVDNLSCTEFSLPSSWLQIRKFFA